MPMEEAAVKSWLEPERLTKLRVTGWPVRGAVRALGQVDVRWLWIAERRTPIKRR